MRRVLVPGGYGFIAVKRKTTFDEGFIHEDKAGGIDRYFAFYEPVELDALITRSAMTVVGSYAIADPDGSTTWLCRTMRLPF